MKAYSPDEGDLEALRAMLARQRRATTGAENRPHRRAKLPEAPEVYVAKVPPGGIPPMFSAVSQVAPKAVPGGVECQIYRLDLATGDLETVPGLTRRVYSLGTAHVQGGSTTPVVRDKFGTWWVTCSDCVYPFGTGVDTGTGFHTTGTGTGTGTGQDVVVPCCLDTPLPQRIYLSLTAIGNQGGTGTGTGTFTACDEQSPYNVGAAGGPLSSLDYNCDPLLGPDLSLIIPLDFDDGTSGPVGAFAGLIPGWYSELFPTGYNWAEWTPPGGFPFPGYEVYLQFQLVCLNNIWGFAGHCLYRVDATDFDPYPAGVFNPGIMLDPPSYYPRLYPIQQLGGTNYPFLVGGPHVTCDPFYIDLGCVPLLFCCWVPYEPGVFGWHLVNAALSL